MLQTQTQHVFSHQHQYPQAEPSWIQHHQQQQQQQPQQPQQQQQHHPQQQHQPQQQQHSSLAAQQHAQAQAAAAAAAVAQHQHYNRIALNNNTNNPQQPPPPGANTTTTAGNNSTSANVPDAAAVAAGNTANMDSGISEENRKVLVWVAELMDANRREAALMELSKKREQVPELALIIWHSFGEFLLPSFPRYCHLGLLTCPFLSLGVMTSLLQEIISVYPLLNPSQLTAAASNRVCNALALLQCVASHNETRTLFLNGTSSAHKFSLNIFLYDWSNEIISSSYSSLSLPIFKHDIQIPAVRVPTPHFPWCYRCPGQKWFLRCYQFPPYHRNHPALPSNNGNRLRT